MHARHSDGLTLLCTRALCSWPYTMNPKGFMHSACTPAESVRGEQGNVREYLGLFGVGLGIQLLERLDR